MDHRRMYRRDVDPAVEVLLWFAVGIAVTKGVDFVTLPQVKIDASPFMARLDRDVPLVITGWCYIVFGGLLILSMVTRRRDLCMATLAVLGTWFAGMTAAYVEVARSIDGTSHSPWAWPAAGVGICFAAWCSLAGHGPVDLAQLAWRGLRGRVRSRQ